MRKDKLINKCMKNEKERQSFKADGKVTESEKDR